MSIFSNDEEKHREGEHFLGEKWNSRIISRNKNAIIFHRKTMVNF